MDAGYSFLDALLTWTRRRPGRSAVLRRQPAGGWDELGRTDATEFRAKGLDPQRPLEFAAAPVLEDGSLAPEEDWADARIAPMTDVATPVRPETPAHLGAAQDGAIVHLRWDRATDGRTMSYEIRTGDSWQDGRLIAADVVDPQISWPWWTSGEQHFHVAAVDRFGRASAEKASTTLTIEPLTDHVDANVEDEAGDGWLGTQHDVEVDGGELRLRRLPPCFGARTQPLGRATWPFDARYATSGTYETPTLNVGHLETERVEVDLGHTQPIDDLPFGAIRRRAVPRRRRRDGMLLPLGVRGFWARTNGSLRPLMPVDVFVEIDTSATAGGAWDGWRCYVPGCHTFWRVRLRVTLRGDGLRYVSLPRLLWRHRRRNKKDEGLVVLPGGAPEPVDFNLPTGTFRVPPIVTATLQAAAGADGVRIEVTSVTRNGCSIEAFDGTGDSIAATVGWHALGP